jgi:long-chain acyl-CoA synthetase
MRPDAFNLGDIVAKGGDFDAEAIIDLGGEAKPRIYSRRQLDELSNAAARGFVTRGLTRGDRIAILSANRIEFVASVLGGLRAGLVAVPINFRVPDSVVAHILRDSNAKLAICDRQRETAIPRGMERTVFDMDGPNGFSLLLDFGAFEPVRPRPAEPALFLYTSGSSGQPKGVVLSHQAHLWVLRARPRRPGSQRVLMAAPLYHMNGLMTSFGSVSQTNSVLVLLPFFTAPTFIEAIEQYRCSVLNTIPSMIAMMLQETERVRRLDTSEVELVRLGSAPVTQALIDQTRAVFPKADVVNVYGATETGGVVFGPHPGGLPRPSLSVGYPHPDVEIRLAGADSLDIGVLQIRCPALMNGYYNRPDATRQAMTSDGYFITGDLFRKDQNGFFYFIGRSDDMFVCGGENIFPGEIESVLERHPEIHQAAVVPVRDAIKGTKPVAFVVCKTNATLTEDAVREYSRSHLALFQHPRRVWFLPQLPVAGTNKIDRQSLTALASELSKATA